jgi:hypothetical protein
VTVTGAVIVIGVEGPETLASLNCWPVTELVTMELYE